MPELQAVLRNPQLEPRVKVGVLDDLLGGADELVHNFLRLVAEKGRSGQIEGAPRLQARMDVVDEAAEQRQKPSIVGRSVRLNGTDFNVIGVAPETFPGLQIFARPDVYVPLAMARLASVATLNAWIWVWS